MVVVDSSALIPLAWVGRLDLLEATLEDVRTIDAVEQEVLVEGKRGTARLAGFLDDVPIHETPPRATEVANMEGIAVADAGVILLAADQDERLLANDRGLVTAAQSHGVECWWVTTLLLSGTKRGVLSSDEATDVLYDLVDEGMNLHPKVYAQVQQKLRELGD